MPCLEIDELTATGYPRNLTPKQKDQLETFRQMLEVWRSENVEVAAIEKACATGKEDEKSMTVLYLKFLRARQFDLDQSFKLYTSFLVWKKEFQGIGVNNITLDSVMNEVKTGKCISFGTCKAGRPVIWIRFKLHKKSQSDPKEAERFIAWFFESAKHIPRNYPIETTTTVVDLSSIGMENMDMTIARSWMEMLGSRYPECLGQGLLLNAPWLFSTFWNLLKPFIDPRTYKKLKWVNSSDLDKFIDEESILKEYGGKGVYSMEEDPVYKQYLAR